MFFLSTKKYLKHKNKIDWSTFSPPELKVFIKIMKSSSGYMVKKFPTEDQNPVKYFKCSKNFLVFNGPFCSFLYLSKKTKQTTLKKFPFDGIYWSLLMLAVNIALKYFPKERSKKLRRKSPYIAFDRNIIPVLMFMHIWYRWWGELQSRLILLKNKSIGYIYPVTWIGKACSWLRTFCTYLPLLTESSSPS